jgi:hypothetical protein
MDWPIQFQYQMSDFFQYNNKNVFLKGEIMASKRFRKKKSCLRTFRNNRKCAFRKSVSVEPTQYRILPGDSVLIELSGKELWIFVVAHKVVNGRDYFRGIVHESMNQGEIPYIPNLVINPAKIIQVRRFDAA